MDENMYISSDEEEAVLFLALEEENQRRKKHRIWVHNINRDRNRFGEYHTLMPQLRQDESRFQIYFRMSIQSFDEILSLIRPAITKIDTNFREAIPPGERLAVALRYLATGDSFRTIGYSFRIGFETVSQIVIEVCDAIDRIMCPIYMPVPTTELWKKSAAEYQERWRFPNCIGSIDGKHVTIKCPNNTGSNHYCYLHKFSIVLMAIVGPDYRFICVDVGAYGKNSDGGIFEASNMGQRFEEGLMNVPNDCNLPGQDETCPYVLIGDEAFALKPYLMRPFPYRQSRGNNRKEMYNTMHGKARRLVEQAFGILSQKWRIFFRPMETKDETTKLVVKSACVLHNFLRIKQDNIDFDEDPDNQYPDTQQILTPLEHDPRRATNLAFQIREKFVDYFNG